MNANPDRDYSGRLRNLFRTAAGAREQVMALLLALALFLSLIVLASAVMINLLPLGEYGTLQVHRRFYVIVVLWLLFSLLLALAAVRVSLGISERVTGPVKRMERFLDCALENKDSTLVLREKDALCGIARKINQLIESQKNIPR